MAIRTIEVFVDRTDTQTGAIHNGGIQYEDNATEVKFVISPSLLSDLNSEVTPGKQLLYRIEYVTEGGEKFSTDNIELSGDDENEIKKEIPYYITSSPGNTQMTLVISLVGEDTEMVVYSYPAFIRFKHLETGVDGDESESTAISEALEVCKNSVVQARAVLSQTELIAEGTRISENNAMEYAMRSSFNAQECGDYVRTAASAKTASQNAATSAAESKNGAKDWYDRTKEIEIDVTEELENKADKSTTLSGYGITDGITEDDFDSAMEDFSASFQTMLAQKVDKVSGKQLSTNDFTNENKSRLNAVTDWEKLYGHTVAEGESIKIIDIVSDEDNAPFSLKECYIKVVFPQNTETGGLRFYLNGSSDSVFYGQTHNYNIHWLRLEKCVDTWIPISCYASNANYNTTSLKAASNRMESIGNDIHEVKIEATLNMLVDTKISVYGKRISA